MIYYLRNYFATTLLTRQCLDRRIPDIETLHNETGTWEQTRNGQEKSVDRQFTAEDARIKLKRLYPKFNSQNQD